MIHFNRLCFSVLLIFITGLTSSCHSGSGHGSLATDSAKTNMDSVSVIATVPVTPENFIRAETDKMFYNISRLPGSGINQFYHFAQVTPLGQQTVVRMNRDVLYSGGIVDVEKGATVTFPQIPKGRYASILLVDNDHYCPMVIYKPGTYKLPQDTKYLFMAIRIQVFNAKDTTELALVNHLKEKFIIESKSTDEFKKPNWDNRSLDSLHTVYEKGFSKFNRYPNDWMGPRGQVNEKTRAYACAGAWGLFPNKDATYINYNGGNLSGNKCYGPLIQYPM
jgi:hypothetical protein